MAMADWDVALKAIDALDTFDSFYFKLFREKGEKQATTDRDWLRFECYAKDRKQRKKAMQVGMKLITEGRNASLLNSYAWKMFTEREYRGMFDTMAIAAVTKAKELTKGNDPDVLDTLAMIKFEQGKLYEAVKLERQAVNKATRKEKKAYQKVLDSYEFALQRKEAEDEDEDEE